MLAVVCWFLGRCVSVVVWYGGSWLGILTLLVEVCMSEFEGNKGSSLGFAALGWKVSITGGKVI